MVSMSDRKRRTSVVRREERARARIPAPPLASGAASGAGTC